MSKYFKGMLFSLPLVFILLGAGCASTHKTTTTETTVRTQDSNTVTEGMAQPSTTVVAKTDTTTTTSTPPRQDGILGATFHVIGTILAFPFVVIGGLLKMIF